MSYTAALEKAYDRLSGLATEKRYSVRFLSENYSVDLTRREITSIINNKPAKDFLAVLLLHYLIIHIEGLPGVKGKWISFREIEGGEFYYPAFRKRAIDLIIRKYGGDPQALLNNLERLNGKKASFGDCGIEIEVFDGVPVMITVSGADEELPAEANILFDENIRQVFVAEDVAVLAGFVAGKI
ncbi:MAG: DUF3786 domain-containing protein [Candidatus Omnitrophica bacterium]|nr:DUF3786 domain-containing protein [Candidatus Omnitrophota bacterium]